MERSVCEWPPFVLHDFCAFGGRRRRWEEPALPRSARVEPRGRGGGHATVGKRKALKQLTYPFIGVLARISNADAGEAEVVIQLCSIAGLAILVIQHALHSSTFTSRKKKPLELYIYGV